VAQAQAEKAAKLSPPDERVTELAKAIYVARMAGPLATLRPDAAWHINESFKAAEAFYADVDTRPGK